MGKTTRLRDALPTPAANTSELVGMLSRLAELASGRGEPLEPVMITVDGSAVRIVLTIGPKPPASTQPANLPRGVTPLQKAILKAASCEPLTAKKLAAKLGKDCSGYFRDQLRGLVRRIPALLLHTPDGYRLPYGQEGY